MISVIVPCYNSGEFLHEAVASVFQSSHQDFELIIVDDGSTDKVTLQVIDELKAKEKVTVLHQPNKGVGSARNYGVAHAKGEFLLFLDADNRIRTDYMSDALTAFSGNSSLGVVYGKPYFFNHLGDAPKRFTTRPYSFDSLLVGNYIDMCALVRKEAFEEVNGFDASNQLFGWEDWDLWIRMGLTRWQFQFLDKVLYDYRVHEQSTMAQLSKSNYDKKVAYMGAKYGHIYFSKMKQYFPIASGMSKNPFKYVLVYLLSRYILKKSTS
jgi:glycosyltransferase involved in cell wall biosynthesis